MASKFREVFKSRHTLLPVIHVWDEDQTDSNISIARNCDAAGVFLINHDVTVSELESIARRMGLQYPDMWIGINVLGHNQSIATQSVSKSAASGLWIDNACLVEGEDAQPKAQALGELVAQTGAMYFGGVAFKYVHPVFNDPAAMAKVATRYMDVVTTSGEGTGIAADVGKIRSMKEAIGDFPLAIASGITPENIGDYAEWLDGILVNTGVSRVDSEGREYFDPVRLQALADQLELK